MQDITDVKAAEEQIAFLAYHDRLTGLPNLAMLDARSARWRSPGRSARDQAVAVLFVDIDGFKLANDSLGSEVGDRLLGDRGRAHRAPRSATPTPSPGGAATSSWSCWRDLERGEVGEMQAPLLFAESVAGRESARPWTSPSRSTATSCSSR